LHFHIVDFVALSCFISLCYKYVSDDLGSHTTTSTSRALHGWLNSKPSLSSEGRSEFGRFLFFNQKFNKNTQKEQNITK